MFAPDIVELGPMVSDLATPVLLRMRLHVLADLQLEYVKNTSPKEMQVMNPRDQPGRFHLGDPLAELCIGLNPLNAIYHYLMRCLFVRDMP